jgi:hypothetical protein
MVFSIADDVNVETLDELCISFDEDPEGNKLLQDMVFTRLSRGREKASKSIYYLLYNYLPHSFPGEKTVVKTRILAEKIRDQFQDFMDVGLDPQTTQLNLANARTSMGWAYEHFNDKPIDLIVASYVLDILFKGGNSSCLTNVNGFIDFLRKPAVAKEQKDHFLKIIEKNIMKAVESYRPVFEIISDPNYQEFLSAINRNASNREGEYCKIYLNSSIDMLRHVWSNLQELNSVVGQYKLNTVDTDVLNTVPKLIDEIMFYSFNFTLNLDNLIRMTQKLPNWERHGQRVIDSIGYLKAIHPSYEFNRHTHEDKVNN